MAIGYVIAALILLRPVLPRCHHPVRHRRPCGSPGFALWPFGRTVVRRPDAGVASAIGNVLWVVLCGWWLALEATDQRASPLCLTIIGIPFGIANFKLIPVSLLPLGRDIVTIEQAQAMGLPALVTVGEQSSTGQLPPPR